MATIGVCEDQHLIRNALTRGLRAAGHRVVQAVTGAEALKFLGPDSDVDAIVMDIGLPDADGRDVVQALKAAGQQAPVLFLTALDSTDDIVQGLAVGADDYVVKPFEIKEVIARLEVLVWRALRTPSPEPDVVLDRLSHALRTEHGEVALTPTEYRMLAVIMDRPGKVVPRKAVIAAGWPDGDVAPNTVDSLIRRLRIKIDSVSSPATIHTVRGSGFTFE